jgi:hypothetical protein
MNPGSDTRDWIRSLKVRDEVVIVSRMGTAIVPVTKLTNRGGKRQVLCYNSTFNERGRRIGTSSWNLTHIVPCTDKIRIEVEQAHRLNYLTCLSWKDLPQEALDTIFRIAKAAKDGNPIPRLMNMPAEVRQFATEMCSKQVGESYEKEALNLARATVHWLRNEGLLTPAVTDAQEAEKKS